MNEPMKNSLPDGSERLVHRAREEDRSASAAIHSTRRVT